MRVTSSASSSVRFGRIEGSEHASKVFPAPCGPRFFAKHAPSLFKVRSGLCNCVLHFDEREPVRVFSDQIDLAATRPEIPLEYFIAALFQEQCGDAFARVPKVFSRARKRF